MIKYSEKLKNAMLDAVTDIFPFKVEACGHYKKIYTDPTSYTILAPQDIYTITVGNTSRSWKFEDIPVTNEKGKPVNMLESNCESNLCIMIRTGYAEGIILPINMIRSLERFTTVDGENYGVKKLNYSKRKLDITIINRDEIGPIIDKDADKAKRAEYRRKLTEELEALDKEENA